MRNWLAQSQELKLVDQYERRGECARDAPQTRAATRLSCWGGGGND